MPELTKYTVFSLDVWGNPEDGLEINNWFKQESIEASTDAEILDLLGLDPEECEVEDYQNGCAKVNHIETGKPIYELQYTC